MHLKLFSLFHHLEERRESGQKNVSARLKKQETEPQLIWFIMSAVVDISGSTTEKLIHHIPTMLTQTKSVSRWMINYLNNLNYYTDKTTQGQYFTYEIRPMNQSL